MSDIEDKIDDEQQQDNEDIKKKKKKKKQKTQVRENLKIEF